jgi:membrane protein required for colicin V production
MNFLDIIILIPVAIFVFKGLKNGLIIEVASLVALFLGIFSGIYLSDYVSGFLIKHLGLNANYTSAVAFVLIFIAVLILMRIIAKAIGKAIDLTALGFINKLLGAVFAVLKVLFLISLVFYVINKFDTKEKLITPTAKTKSFLYKPVSEIAPLTIPLIKTEYEKLQPKDTLSDKN